MKLLIYKDGLCDPEHNIGFAASFGNDQPSMVNIEEWLKFFVASMQPKAIKNFRAFVVNDEVPFEEVDNYIIFNEPISIGMSKKIEEINLFGIGLEVNVALKKAERRWRERRAKAMKMVREQDGHAN